MAPIIVLAVAVCVFGVFSAILSSDETRAEDSGFSVSYHVTGTSSKTDITYVNQSNSVSAVEDTSLDWHKNVEIHDNHYARVTAHNDTGDDAGPISCAVYVNGERVSVDTASGRSASVSCVADADVFANAQSDEE